MACNSETLINETLFIFISSIFYCLFLFYLKLGTICQQTAYDCCSISFIYNGSLATNSSPFIYLKLVRFYTYMVICD